MLIVTLSSTMIRRVTDVLFDESADDYNFDAWFEIQTTEENHRKFTRRLVGENEHEELNQRLNIRTTESGGRFCYYLTAMKSTLITLLRLPKED